MNRNITNSLSILALALGFVLSASTASAAETQYNFAPSVENQGPWVVTNLFKESDWKIESTKVDHGIAAWTAVNATESRRRLYAFDGMVTRKLADMPLTEWDRDNGNLFFEQVAGNYDVADGVIVWTASDGSDREIWKFTLGVTTKVSDNSFDDRHPITDAGRIAWTTQPGSAYNLMVNDQNGTYLMDAYHVPNYAFSGANLYWLNKLAGEDWFRVFVNDGRVSTAIGQGDDRPLTKYFFTDGKGSAAWEYSTKQWSYDKRRIYTSVNGSRATEVIQRDVPPTVTYLEDVEGDTIAVNVHDLLTTRIADVDLMIGDASQLDTVEHMYARAKVRFTDDAYARHETPENGSYVQVVGLGGGTDFIALEAVIHERFDADGPTVAGALVKGGIVLYRDHASTTVATNGTVRSLDVTNGDVIWVQEDGSLRMATQGLLVHSAARGTYTVTGTLVKASGSSAVYLAANDGKRYVFPSAAQYFSWYTDWSGVRTISGAQLATVPVGGNVLFAKDSVLVKSATSPRVYLVGSNGSLHWVQTPIVLEARYGAAWNAKVVTLTDALFADYMLGRAITGMGDYGIVLTSI